MKIMFIIIGVLTFLAVYHFFMFRMNKHRLENHRIPYHLKPGVEKKVKIHTLRGLLYAIAGLVISMYLLLTGSI